MSTPVPKGSDASKQGAHGSVPGVSQKSSRFRLGYRKRTLFRRTCAQLLTKPFQSPLFDSTVVHATFHKPCPSAAFSCRAFVNCRQVNNLLNISVALTFSPCVSLTFLLTVGIELTANQCQSVSCAVFRSTACSRKSRPGIATTLELKNALLLFAGILGQVCRVEPWCSAGHGAGTTSHSSVKNAHLLLFLV